MMLSMSEDTLQTVLDALEKQHRDMMEKGTSWSYNLEGDYDNYVQFRQKELTLAVIINNLKKQRTARRENPSAASGTSEE